MPLTKEEIGQIATKTADEVMERVSLEREERELRDHIIGGAMGEGAIPLYGRETRKEPCSCCLIEPEGPNSPENRMCTTSGAIGTLKDREEREWCSEINIVSDGRCQRARSIREAARECKERYPEDTAKFFACYAPAFSKITGGNNPGRSQETELKRLFCTPAKCVHGQRGNGCRLGLWPTHPNCIFYEEAKTYLRSKQALSPSVSNLRGSNPGEYVTITDQGKTTFKVGEVISREAFDKENERVAKLGEKLATGIETIDLSRGRMIEIPLDEHGKATPSEER